MNNLHTNTNIGSYSANINITDIFPLYHVIKTCFTKFSIVKESRIRVNLRIYSFVDNSSFWMNLNNSNKITVIFRASSGENRRNG